MAEQIIYAAYQQFRELCQQGKLCWQNRPLPFHVLTGRPFCGINLVLLSLADSDCAAWIDQSGAKRLELDLTEMKRQCIVTFSTEYSKIKIKSAPVYSLSGTQMQSAMPEEPWRSYQLLEDLKIPYKSTEIFNPQVR